MLKKSFEASASSATTFILIASIIAGALFGHFSPKLGQELGDIVDYTLLLLVTILFFGVRFETLIKASSNWRFLAIALVANFFLVPIIGYGIASIFLFDHPLLFVGLVIYFMAPCTDWFLGFTRLSGGNVALGATLLPINMVLQLLLYPFYLELFTQQIVEVNTLMIANSMMNWFLLPLASAVMLHQILRKSLPPQRFDKILQRADQTTPWLIGLLVFVIFSANINTILEHQTIMAWMLLAVFIFFLLTFLLGEGLSYVFRLSYPERALLTMTIAARNAPLMLAVTMAALPGQPLIYAALVMGMLMELPHLTALRRLLLVIKQHAENKNVLDNTRLDNQP
ncbi:MAG: arsenic resistance protein [Pseudomonadota bacterium]